MKNCLILLTNYYPFHKGEEYLETEIYFLAKKYSKIYIISTMAGRKMKLTREVPSNISIIKSNIDHSIIGKFKMVLSSRKQAKYKINNNILLKEDGKGSILKKTFTFYFESRAQYIYGKIVKDLENENLNKYDNITVYSYWFYITARIGVELKLGLLKEKKPYMLSRAHGYDINEHVNFIGFLPQRKFLLENTNAIYPVSQNGTDFLQNKYLDYAEKIKVRRLGTKIAEKKIMNNNKILHVVSCSTVRKLKRIDLIIDALQLLKEKEIKFNWTHIGDGPEFKKIKEIAIEKLGKEYINFTGAIKNSEVIKWYQKNSATLFINTSESEGVPISIMEAMSMGVPVIATDVGGTKEIIDSNVTGFLLKANCSPQDIEKAILKVMKMTESEYRIMSEAAYDYWNENSRADKLYQDFANEISLSYKL